MKCHCNNSYDHNNDKNNNDNNGDIYDNEGINRSKWLRISY